MSDPCTVAIKAYTDYYNASQSGVCNLDNNSNMQQRGEYCSTCIPKYDALLSEIKTACAANMDPSLQLNYDYVKFSKGFLCGKDASTGEYCDEVYKRGFNFKAPYAQWDASVCSSSCVATVDASLREVAGNAQFCGNYGIDPKLYTGSTNPVSNCAGAGGAAAGGAAGAAAGTGAAGGVAGTGATGTGAAGASGTVLSGAAKTGFAQPTLTGNTSDANTLNAQVCLLSLIICLIFALLK